MAMEHFLLVETSYVVTHVSQHCLVVCQRHECNGGVVEVVQSYVPHWHIMVPLSEAFYHTNMHTCMKTHTQTHSYACT